MSTVVEYRLSWESPKDFHLIAAIEDRYGKNVWPNYDWETLGEWLRTEVVFIGNDRFDQYHTLKRWAETREQPIRDVLLEKREIVSPDEGWEAA